MKLFQVIDEALVSVQKQCLSPIQTDRLVATQLRGYLLSIHESQRSYIFERFKNERVYGIPLLNWLLEADLLHCATVYLDIVFPFGFNSIGLQQFDRDIFLNLIQEGKYQKLLCIIDHFKAETTNWMHLFFKDKYYEALFFRCTPQTVFNSAYLSLLQMALSHISFSHISKSYFLNIYKILSDAQQRAKSQIEFAHENMSKRLEKLHRAKQFLQQLSTEERQNKAKLQTSDENISPTSSPEKKKIAPTSRLDFKHLLQKADLNIAELETLKTDLNTEITQQSKELPEKEQMRKVLIFNCKGIIERKMPDCDEIAKNYEKAALTLRQMR